ncbi:MAG: HAMP domain-containing histidine kinase [Symploca sp. SIO2C1]|nr:HAMP domain-containing histidine kinase [Symploca sp. SIO2C1]
MPFLLPPATTCQTKQITSTAYELPLLPGDPLTKEQFCVIFTNSFSLVMAAGKNNHGMPAFRFSFDPKDVQKAWASLYPRILLTSSHQLDHIETLVQKFAPQTPDYRTVMQFSRLLLQNLPAQSKTEQIDTISVPCEHLIAQSELTESGSNIFKSPHHSIKTSKQAIATGTTLQNKQQPSFNQDEQPHWQPMVKNEERGVKKIANSEEATPDVELLQALTHEIRTPLTTIRTLTKLLLKRRDLAPEVKRRLEIIDHECTEQINRMELIFRAAELETAAVKQKSVNLTSMSLAQIFGQSIPRWQKQAQRRDLTLDVILPQQLPTVVSNPNLLDQVLTGLMENFTRSLPTGSHIQLHVTPAGNQLKLQFQSQPDPSHTGNSLEDSQASCPTVKSIGQLLMFQPETGSLSLNLNVTKNLFQALGGKLIVRQRPQEAEVMTIFLPLEVSQSDNCHPRDFFVKK